MKPAKVSVLLLILAIFTFILPPCSLSPVATAPTATDSPAPTATATITLTPTNTSTPSPTPSPTQTPDLAATQHSKELNAEIQAYFDKGYLATVKGKMIEYNDFTQEWAQLGRYPLLSLGDQASDFYMSAHFKWSSAYRNADLSGCGFAFAIQENYEHYAVFLDRTQLAFVSADSSSPIAREVGLTRGTGHVGFNNPADSPAEADFTLIVKGIYAYVLVDGKLIGEYTLSQSKALKGNVGLTLLSGTNKDYGTRCEMTNVHLWIPTP